MYRDLDQLVSENRFTISVIFPLVGAFGFIASAEGWLPGFMAFNPFMILFGTIVMRLPILAGIRPLLGRKEVFALLLLSLYSYCIEYIGLRTGWPYGEFDYLISLGPMFGDVPLGLPLFFIPLVLNSYFLVNLFDVEDFFKRFFYTLLTVLLVDLVLDPAAVSLGIWSYSSQFIYGVPLSNFFGWIISGTIAVVILELFLDRLKISARLSEKDYMLDDMVSFIFLWGFINLYYLNLIPVLVTLLFCVFLYRTDRFSLAFEEKSGNFSIKSRF